jgi:hypothetical protein
MGEAVTLDEALAFVRQLSPLDKARLIERMVPDIERELRAARSTPYVSLCGLWRGLDITEEEIDQAREEMWVEFPREDI